MPEASSHLFVHPVSVREGQEVRRETAVAKLTPHQSTTHGTITVLGGGGVCGGVGDIEVACTVPVCIPSLHDDLPDGSSEVLGTSQTKEPST